MSFYYAGLTDALPRSLISLFVFLTISILMVVSCFKAIYTDPGRVPPYWGFWMGDLDQKRKRYCLQCHIFKPERTHHCSTCSRCVLNMDHHCPWLNNCVGYNNRKFFMLYLLYACSCLIFIALSLLPDVFNIFYLRFVDGILMSVFDRIIISAYCLNVFLLVFLSMFTKFHITLVINNRTTIENLEIKRTGNVEDYNQGPLINIYYVFGKNVWLWPFPWTGDTGRPWGDGVTWGKKIRELEIFSDNSMSMYQQKEKEKETNSNIKKLNDLRNQINQISRPQNNTDNNHELIDLNNNNNNNNGTGTGGNGNGNGNGGNIGVNY